MEMKNILVVGSVNMDLTIYTKRLPIIGETITGEKFSVSPGGKGSNQAIAAARLGGNVKFLGMVGDDIYGKELIDNFITNNVNFCGEVISNCSTGISVITVCNGDNSIILHQGANGKITAEHIQKYKDLFEWADYVVMQAEIPKDAIIESAKLAKKCSAEVVFNPAPYTEFGDDLYNYVDIIVLNETEAELLTGVYPEDKESICKVFKFIGDKGISDVILTLGERGAVYNDEEQLRYMEAEKVTVVDTTAAGDCFIGAFVREKTAGKTKSDAIKFATKAASVAVSRYGAGISLPTLVDVQ